MPFLGAIRLTTVYHGDGRVSNDERHILCEIGESGMENGEQGEVVQASHYVTDLDA